MRWDVNQWVLLFLMTGFIDRRRLPLMIDGMYRLVVDAAMEETCFGGAMARWSFF